MNLSIYNLLQYLQSEGEDELKKRQLMELAIINGTYRDSQSKHSSRKLYSFVFTLINLILTISCFNDPFSLQPIIKFAFSLNLSLFCTLNCIHMTETTSIKNDAIFRLQRN